MKQKAEKYFTDGNLKLGDVIEISNSSDKDGKYIIFSDEDRGTFLRSMCPLKVSDNGKYKYIAGYSTQGLQGADYDADLEILGNILEDYKLNNKTNNKMKITNIVKQILDADTRKLVKAGFINGDLALTEEGTSELLGILFLANKAELVKIADEKLADETK